MTRSATNLRTPLPDRRRVLATGLRLAALAGVAAAFPLARARAALPTAAAPLAEAVERARDLPRLRTLLVARAGEPLVEEVFRGPGLDRPVNVKSVAKSVISALVGIAIGKGLLEGLDQPIAPLLEDKLPKHPDPRLRAITIGHLLAMRAGLERTSGPFYGAWVTSRDWVRYALSRPFVDEPGGAMLYSTGNTHLLSAILTRVSGRSTLALARAWLGEPLDITIPPWPKDPQGIYFGGNDMLLSPRAMLRFGELYRQGGVFRGQRVLPEGWVEASWTPQVHSPFTGHAYGLGWFRARAQGQEVAYAWGYGGQMLHVVPGLELVSVMTSDTDAPSGRTGYARELHALLADHILPAAVASAG